VGWAGKYIETLQQGKSVKFRPRGNSILQMAVGDIVLCKVNGIQYPYLIKAISGDRVQIGNNKGRINGWTLQRNIFGVVTEISS